MSIPNAVDKILLSEEAIARRVQELADQISEDYADKEGSLDIMLVGVLRGAFIFLADLARRLEVAHEVDFVGVSSYGAAGAVSSGAVRFVLDTRADVTGRHIIVVEDIIDTGYTLEYLMRSFEARHPASVKSCVLLSKPDRRKIDVDVDYLGFEIPDVWVVGYGLDYANRFRTLPYIAGLKREVYQKD